MASVVKDTLGLPTAPFIAPTAPKDAAVIEATEISESESPKDGQSHWASESHPAAGTPNANLLISSPYLELHHRLDLTTLDAQSALVARALTALDPATPVYATSAYTSALTWSAVIAHLRKLCVEQNHTWTKQAFYVVAFYSKLKDSIDRDLLHQLDKESHAEAVQSGGLLKYWFGSPNEQRRNLATCVWRAEKDAKTGGTGPWHKRARTEARNLYEVIEFKRMEFVVDDGVEDWSIS